MKFSHFSEVLLQMKQLKTLNKTLDQTLDQTIDQIIDKRLDQTLKGVLGKH